MARKYIEVSATNPGGKALISLSALSEIAKCVLEDLPNVSFEDASKVNGKSGVNIIVDKPILCREEKGQLSIFIHILARQGENASSLANLIQQEVGEQIEAETELANCFVNVKIDGMF